jgi:holo-[acyl-carrier protein] synthase
VIAEGARRQLTVGSDVTSVLRVEESLASFGARYLRRVFAQGEVAYACEGAGRVRAERLAARFAAKEATMKALSLSERGVAWSDIEVVRDESGACRLALHGEAAAAAREAGVEELALSLSHEGDYAFAVVVGRIRDRDTEEPET